MTSPLHARAAIGVAALLVALFLLFIAGCEEEDPPDPGGPSAQPRPTGSNTPSEPTLHATEPLRSPIAIVRAWVAAYNLTLRDGDANTLTKVTGPSCETCAALRASVEEVYRAGGFFRGGRWTVDAAKVTNRAAGSIKVTTGITASAGMSRDHRRARPEPYPEDKFIIEFAVGRAEGNLVVTRMVFLS